jgi:hypothetical protein
LGSFFAFLVTTTLFEPGSAQPITTEATIRSKQKIENLFMCGLRSKAAFARERERR